jgi:acetyl esterase/lipase
MPVDDFHPDLRRVARWLPRAAVSRRTLNPIRLLTGLQAKRPTKAIEVKAVAATSVRVHRPAPTGHPVPALLWIHGGGYVLGTAAQDDAVCRHFARELGIIVAAVDYRLAPDHPFPAPLHDCHDALAWLARRPDVDPNRVAVGGASAGGGLAAALALLAHQRGEVRLVFQLLTYPMLDDRTAIRTDGDERHFRMWNTKANRFGWQSYLGHPPGGTAVSGLAAPARLDDLAQLLQRGSVWERVTPSTWKTSPTPSASERPASRVNSTWWRAHSTVSISCSRRLECRRSFGPHRWQPSPQPCADLPFSGNRPGRQCCRPRSDDDRAACLPP